MLVGSPSVDAQCYTLQMGEGSSAGRVCLRGVLACWLILHSVPCLSVHVERWSLWPGILSQEEPFWAGASLWRGVVLKRGTTC